MDISIIIVSFNTKKILKECVESVISYTKGIEYEIVVVDNNSKDGSVEYLKKLKKTKNNIKLIENKKNLGFGKANNIGFEKADGRYVLLLNSDTFIKNNLLKEMVAWMDENRDIGISSCALLNKDGSTQGTGGYFPTLFRAFLWMTFLEDIPFLANYIKTFHPVHNIAPFLHDLGYFESEKELDWVTGAFMLMRKDVYKKTGGFDEDYFMYTEETDLCYKVKQLGWRVVYEPKWQIVHYGGGSGESWSYVSAEFDGVKLFYRKHYPAWNLWVLRLFLKLGAFVRIFLFYPLKGKEASKAYAEAFIGA